MRNAIEKKMAEHNSKKNNIFHRCVLHLWHMHTLSASENMDVGYVWATMKYVWPIHQHTGHTHANDGIRWFIFSRAPDKYIVSRSYLHTGQICIRTSKGLIGNLKAAHTKGKSANIALRVQWQRDHLASALRTWKIAAEDFVIVPPPPCYPFSVQIWGSSR